MNLIDATFSLKPTTILTSKLSSCAPQSAISASKLLPGEFALIVEERPIERTAVSGLPSPSTTPIDVLQSTYDKVVRLRHEIQESAQMLTSASDQALFDLYALLRILAEVAQAQRDSARAMRKAASAQAKIYIQEQADLQRSAAYTGLAMGLTACAISVSMQVCNLTLTTTAKVKQEHLGKAMGLPEAQKAYAKEVKLETCDAKRLATEVRSADKTLVRALGEAEANTFKNALINAPEVRQARETVTETHNALTEAQEALVQNPQDEGMQANLNNALEHHLEAVGNYRTALNTQAEHYEALAKALPNDVQASARAQSARLYQRQASVELPGNVNALAETPATHRFNLIQAAVQNDPTFKRWATVANVGQSMSQVTMSVGQALNVTAQNFGQLQNAKASEAAATAAKHRAAAEAADAIFTQEATVLSSVLEMMRGILRVENQSMEMILRA